VTGWARQAILCRSEPQDSFSYFNQPLLGLALATHLNLRAQCDQQPPEQQCNHHEYN
jgi:hypothetical protein